jgi:hypothetical protein
MFFMIVFKRMIEMLKYLVCQPWLTLRMMSQIPRSCRGFNYSRCWKSVATEKATIEDRPASPAISNPLKVFFDARVKGRGIWKWEHYFDIYHRHLSRFVGCGVDVLEIGVYSGGSLEMWRHYFGSKSRIYGVDREESCKCYENEYTKIVIGDQGDSRFWDAFSEHVPAIDVLVDDGGHTVEQQIVTLEKMLPRLRPGGVYICEDIVGNHNGFAAFMHGLVDNLNAANGLGPEARANATEFQSWINSVHFYPYVTVIEKAKSPLRQLIAPKHGTEWQPFL